MTERELRRLIASDHLTEQQLGRLSNTELAELRRILLGALANHLTDGVAGERRAVSGPVGGSAVEAATRNGRAVDASVTEDGQKVYTGA
ncbi:MAG TPA: hypothetical protein VMZ31_08450 [Phycisphaerae bacterium]|nr:hypothetical protein [Phycisphaerae bacterium]